MKHLLSLVLIFCNSLFAERGMVTLYHPEEMETLFISLTHLQYSLETSLPIEVWYSEEDITTEEIEKLSAFEGVELCKLPQDPVAFSFLSVLEKSRFDEIIWFLPQITFVNEPALLFEDESYHESGAYFFMRQERLSKEMRRVTPTQQLATLCFLGSQLHSYRDKLPYDVEEKIYSKGEKFVAKWQIMFADPALLVIDRKLHENGLEEALWLAQSPQWQRITEMDLLWIGMMDFEEKFSFNMMKQLKLKLQRDEESSKVVAAVQLYRSKLHALEDITPPSDEEHEVCEPDPETSDPETPDPLFIQEQN